METNSNKSNSSNEKNQSQDAGFDFAGIDFEKLLGGKSAAEFIKHLLSGAGAMAGNYFLWIKPMQEKMDAMNEKLIKQEIRIKDLETDQDKLIQELEEEKRKNQEVSETGLSGGGLFAFKRSADKPRYGSRYRTARI